MEFKRRELRNGNNQMLRKVQRKIDAENSLIPMPKEDLSSFNKKSMMLDSKEESFFEEPIKKKDTRLPLYGNRCKRRWTKYL